ncbi:hypothetical protein ACF1AE_16510 [Streptomyces sp. NPDC014986]|uniref:hypothetical protein n=1 Tax=Streptomyces sp. NPDC014986 TaxID=3364934 RepID=UPI00370344C8
MDVVEVADPGAQGPGVDGSGDEVGDAEGVRGGAGLPVAGEAGEQDGGDVPGPFRAPQVAYDVEPAGAGRVDAEEQQADGAAQQLFEGFVAAGGPARQVAQRGQGALRGVQGVLVAVDDEDPGVRRHGARPSS